MPGSSATCWWHFSAVWLRQGSIATSFAPRRFASWQRDHRCRLETIGFEPQMRMSLASSKRSGSMPTEPPSVSFMPTLPADEQSVRSSRLAPSRWKKRRSIDVYCSRPIVPA